MPNVVDSGNKFTSVLAILLQNNLHMKNSDRVESATNGSYCDITSPESAK